MSYAAIVVGLGTVAVGAVSKHQANQNAKDLAANRPKYKISDEFQDDVSLTESDLAKGMSSRAERAYSNLADRDLTSSLSTILKGGGDVNSVGALYGNAEQGREQRRRWLCYAQ